LLDHTWKASGTSKVALSLDSPGFYAQFKTGSVGTYAAQGTLDLKFECDPAVQPNTTHTYTLNTVSTPSIQKTISVTEQTSP
jgi:hypothetical protein